MKKLLLGSLLLVLIATPCKAANDAAFKDEGASCLNGIGAKRLVGGGDFAIDKGIIEKEFVSYRSSYYLYRVGKGVDVTRCGFYSYDSFEIQSEVFDRQYLNSLYLTSGDFYQPPAAATTNIAKSSSFKGLSTQMSSDISTGISADASLPYVELSMSTSSGFSTECKMKDCETTFIYNSRHLHYKFDYELPSFGVNKSNYLSHLNPEYLSELTSCISRYNGGRNLDVFFPLFRNYGTGVLWRGGFGGACDILYTAHSNKVDLDSSVNENVSTSIGAKVEKAAAGKVTTEIDLASQLGKTSTVIDEKLKARFVGGDSELVGIVNNLAAVTSRATSWANSIGSSPALVSFRGTEPLWKFLPEGMQGYSGIIADAIELYKEKQTEAFEDQIDAPICYENNLDEQYVYLKDGEKLDFGDYWDVRRDQEFDINLQRNELYNAENLAKCGFKSVEITPTFKLKEIREKTKATVEFSYGNGFGRKAKLEKIDISDKEEHYIENSALVIRMPISELISNHWIHCKFTTNNRSWVFLGWSERGARMTELAFRIKYTK